MRSWILRLEFDRSLQRRNCFGVALGGAQTRSEPHKCVPETWIKLRGAGKMLDGLIPLLALLRQRAQHIFGVRIRGIDLEFLLHLFLRFLGNRRAWVGLREQEPPQAEVDAGRARILLQYQAILLGGLIPFSLGLKSLGVEFTPLRGF